MHMYAFFLPLHVALAPGLFSLLARDAATALMPRVVVVDLTLYAAAGGAAVALVPSRACTSDIPLGCSATTSFVSHALLRSR